MAERVTNCMSCAKSRCSQCGEELGRCARCRQQSNRSICPKYGFQGP